MAGGQHHHRTNLDKYHPGYFGKVGMRHYHLLRNHYWRPIINIDKVSDSCRQSLTRYSNLFARSLTFLVLQLWSLVPPATREEYLSGKRTETAPVLDLLSYGYAKVLGKGRLPKIPLVVRARYVSKEAEEKIKEAGGIVELVA